MKRRIRILCIAPYKAMKSALLRVAEKRNDIDIHVEIGDIEEGAALVKMHRKEHFDAIVSRGGTKLEIEKITDIPVFGIPISYFDLLNVIRLVETYEGKTAIIAYENIAKGAKVLLEILQKDYTLQVINSWTDAKEKVQNLKKEGYSLIIGDTVAVTYAEQFQMQSMLLVSGDESIESAFDQAVNSVTHIIDLSRKFHYINSYLMNQNIKFITFDAKGNIIYKSSEDISQSAINFCIESMGSISEKKPIVMYKKLASYMYTIRGNCSSSNEETLYFFSIQVSFCSYAHLPGWSYIELFSTEELLDKIKVHPRFCENFVPDFRKKCCTLTKSNTPVIIIGEHGTEKDIYASQMHMCSSAKDFPFFMVHCKHLSLSKVENFLNNDNAPLYSLDRTICFKDIDQMQSEAFYTLVNGIESLLPRQKKNIYFICTDASKTHRGIEQHERINYMKKKTKCAELRISPLVSKHQEISNYALLYIHHQNTFQNRSFIGIEPEAVHILCDYSWPENLTQLQRVLDEAMLISPSPRITARVIKKILLSEEFSIKKEQFRPVFPIEGSLKDIEKNIINYILEEEDMNQVRTAKRLGISRTTLWRKLNDK